MSNKKANVKHVTILFLATLAWAASACTAKVEGGGDVPVPVPLHKPVADDFKSAIEGPKVDGVWKSDCVESARDASKYNLITMTIQGQSVSRVSDNFSDAKCQQALDTVTQKGLLRYEKLNYFGQYDVEYRFEMPNGTYSQYEVFGYENNVLYVSNLIGGDAKADVKMTKQGDSQSNPQPSPSPTPNPSPNPNPAPAPATCTDFTGTYQMNSDYFRIEQAQCQSFTWIIDPDYYNPQGTKEVFLADGLEHVMEGRPMKASFNQDGNFTIEFKDDAGRVTKNVFSFQTKPCHLANPNGESYLTREVYVNGVLSDASCSFWARH
jgi:hypothetical protein